MWYAVPQGAKKPFVYKTSKILLLECAQFFTGLGVGALWERQVGVILSKALRLPQQLVKPMLTGLQSSTSYLLLADEGASAALLSVLADGS